MFNSFVPPQSLAAPVFFRPMCTYTPEKGHLGASTPNSGKDPHCGALWAEGERLRSPSFILFFFRTARCGRISRKNG